MRGVLSKTVCLIMNNWSDYQLECLNMDNMFNYENNLFNYEH
jgi:hypothetical protein